MARLDGADTAATIGMPAKTAFWTISNEVRPLTHSSVIGQRQRVAHQHPPDDLVDGVVSADIFGDVDERAVAGEQAGRVQAAGFVEHRLPRAQPLRAARR